MDYTWEHFAEKMGMDWIDSQTRLRKQKNTKRLSVHKTFLMELKSITYHELLSPESKLWYLLIIPWEIETKCTADSFVTGKKHRNNNTEIKWKSTTLTWNMCF